MVGEARACFLASSFCTRRCTGSGGRVGSSRSLWRMAVPMWKGTFATTLKASSGKSTERASPATTSTFLSVAKLCFRRAAKKASYSTATTLRTFFESGRVSIPAPAPNSTTRSLSVTPASLTTFSAMRSSSRKFWPNSRRLSRCCWSQTRRPRATARLELPLPRRLSAGDIRQSPSTPHALIVDCNGKAGRFAVAGLESARARGRHGGRPRALDENRAKLARRLKQEGEHSVEEICSMLGVGRSTLYRYLGATDAGGDRA